MMRKLLCVLAGVMFASVAYADDYSGPPGGYYQPLSPRQTQNSLRRYSGAVLYDERDTSPTGGGSNSTTDQVSFGFLSNFVRLCYQAGGSANTPVYIRFEFDASTDNYSSRLATQSSYFINGTKGVAGLGTRAMVMTGGGDGTDQSCVSIPIQARGVTIHNPTVTAATVDVMAF